MVLHFVNAPKPWELSFLEGGSAVRRDLSRLVRRLAMAGFGEGAVQPAMATHAAAAHSRETRVRQATV